MLSSLSFVLPAYNEESHIAAAVLSAASLLTQLAYRWEIIVVDDGSTDHTAGIVRALSDSVPNVKVVQHPMNLGSGAALWKGLTSSSCEYVFYTDADEQIDLSALPSAILLMNDYEAVIGYRIRRHDNFVRIVGGRIWNWLVNHVFRLDVRDVNCAFKLLRREAVDNISVGSCGAFTNTEMLVKLRESGVKWKQIGVIHHARVGGNPSGGKLGVILLALRDFTAFTLTRSSLRRRVLRATAHDIKTSRTLAPFVKPSPK